MVTITTIEDCGAGKRKAQKVIFKAYGRRLMGVAFRYLNDRMEAEDAVASAFFKIFRSAGKCSFESVRKFEAWMMQIMVNEALALLRKRAKFRTVDLSVCENEPDSYEDVIDELSAAEVLQLIRELPIGYRTVLNLYAIEGYTHPEISQMLDISEGTSRSQLSKARKLLRKKINQLNQYEYRAEF